VYQRECERDCVRAYVSSHVSLDLCTQWSAQNTVYPKESVRDCLCVCAYVISHVSLDLCTQCTKCCVPKSRCSCLFVCVCARVCEYPCLTRPVHTMHKMLRTKEDVYVCVYAYVHKYCVFMSMCVCPCLRAHE